MDKNTLKATAKNKRLEIILNADGGSLPPLVQPATPEEQAAYQQAGEAFSRGSVDEARQILERAGFSVSNNR